MWPWSCNYNMVKINIYHTMRRGNTQIHHNIFLRWPFFTISYFVMVYGLLSIYTIFFSLSSKDRFLSDMSLNALKCGSCQNLLPHLLVLTFLLSLSSCQHTWVEISTKKIRRESWKPTQMLFWVVCMCFITLTIWYWLKDRLCI